jgi:GNAT superfamily N-acetyltransferase
VSPSVIVRDAAPADISAIMRLKLELAIAEDTVCAVRATTADWDRDGFGAGARFIIFVAESRGRVVGMAISAERHSPGWIGPVIVLRDLFVEETFRGHGVGAALIARVAAMAKARGSVMVELTVRSGNRAAALYDRLGFVEVAEARNFVLAGSALDVVASPASGAAK